MAKLHNNLNKFNYPQVEITTYRLKSLSPDDQLKKMQQQKLKKIKYQNFIKRELREERQRVREQQQTRKREAQRQKKDDLRQQLSEKKKQLQKLQQQRIRIIEEHGKAFEKAKEKQHIDNLRRLKSEQKQQEIQKTTAIRYNRALRRLQTQKQYDQFCIHKKQAEHRKNARFQEQMKEKQLVRSYQQQINDKKSQQQKLKTNKAQNKFQNFKQPLGREGYQMIDYRKTRFHNRQLTNVIIQKHKTLSEQNQIAPLQKTAYKSAQVYQQYMEQVKKQSKNREQQARKKSIQRVQNKQKQLKTKKQYEDYCKQAQKMNLQYNMNKIQAGKKSSLIGIKPLTLQQIQKQRHKKVQEEFEKMFNLNNEDTRSNQTQVSRQSSKVQWQHSDLFNRFKERQNVFKLQQLQKKYWPPIAKFQVKQQKYQFETEEEEESIEQPKYIMSVATRNTNFSNARNPKAYQHQDAIKLQYSFSQQSFY